LTTDLLKHRFSTIHGESAIFATQDLDSIGTSKDVKTILLKNGQALEKLVEQCDRSSKLYFMLVSKRFNNLIGRNPL
jgi:hypothetical protein